MINRKRHIFLLTLLLSAAFFRSPAATNIQALAYNQTIMLEQDRVVYRLSEFMQHVSGKNLILLQMQILNSIETLEALQPFTTNDSSFLVAARQLFYTYKEVSKYQYPKILELVENPDIEEADFNLQLDAIRKAIADQVAPADKAFTDEQEKFAQRYGFQFTPQD